MLNIIGHLKEVKYRIFYISFCFITTFLCSYFHIEFIIYLVTLPLLKNEKFCLSLKQSDFIFTNIFEAFSSYIFLSFIITIYLTSPILIYFSFSFIKSGLIKYEKQYLCFVINLFLLCTFFSILFTFQVFLPLFLKFFINFENLAKTHLFTLKLEPKILDYLYLSITFLFWFTFIFQIPLILLLFLKQDFVNFTMFEQSRRFFLITFTLFGSVLSSPEVFAQLMIVLPLCFFFELSLFFSFIKKYYNFFKLNIF